MAASALELLRLQDQAVDILRKCQLQVENQHGPIRVHVNTTSRFGHAWAYHLNVLVGRQSFDSWRDQDWQPLMSQWMPFLATSPVLFGTGKVGAENGRRRAKYQLSQRADFVTDVFHHCTVDRKALINERDEALADRDRFARFHIAAGFDFNLCPFAAWLKCGVTQILLALIEARVPLPNLRLCNPLSALRRVSRDLMLRSRLILCDGSRRTATDVQEELAVAADRAVRQGAIDESIVPDAGIIVRSWMESLDHLRRRSPELRRRIDWAAKLRYLGELRCVHKLGWDDPRLVRADLRFAELGGWFETLREKGQIDEIRHFLPDRYLPTTIRTSQRDMARTWILSRFPASVTEADWHYVVVTARSGETRPGKG